MCNTMPSPFSRSFSPLLSNLRGLHLEVGSEPKYVGVDSDKSDKSIKCLSVIPYQRQRSSLTGLLFR